MSSVEEDGVISVEGEAVGKISGLSFVPDPSIAGNETRVLKAAAVQALAAEVAARAKSLSATADTELKLSRLGFIQWQGQSVGRLAAADARYRPRAEVIADDVLNPADREMVRERLQKFVDRHVTALIEPLVKLEESEGLDGITRGIAYRLAENFGVLSRAEVTEDVKQLSQDDRAKLRGLGVRFGAFTLFLPLLLKPAATELRLLLWWLEKQKAGTAEGDVPAAPANGLTSATADTTKPDGFYRMCGYRLCGPRAVRVDMLERLSDLIRDRVFWKPRFPEEPRPVGSVEGGGFTVVPDMMSLVGCSGEEFEAILASLGFRYQKRMLPKVATPGAKGVAIPAVVVAPDVAVEVSAEPLPEPVAESVAEVVEAEVPAPEAATEPAVVEAPSEEAVTVQAIPDVELVETSVWWPEGMGPFRPQRHKPAPRARHDGEQPQQARDGENRRPHGKPNRSGEKREDRREGKDGKHDRPRFHKGAERKPHENRNTDNRPRRPEKPADPNSPFAVLSALKAQFEKGST